MAEKADSEVSAMNTALSALSGLETDERRQVLLWLIDELKLSGSVSLGTPAPGTTPVPLPPGSPPGMLWHRTHTEAVYENEEAKVGCRPDNVPSLLFDAST